MISKKKEPINSSSLIISIVTLVLGIILCFNGSDGIFKIVGYLTSGILIISGIIKFFMTTHTSKKTQTSLDFSDLITSIFLVAMGIVLAIFPKIIMVTFSILIGVVVIVNGIKRLILGIAVNKVDKNGSLIYIIQSVLVIILGILILTQKFIDILGLFMIIYAIFELAGYIYYTAFNKDYSEVLNKKITKEMKESEAKEAVIDEE